MQCLQKLVCGLTRSRKLSSLAWCVEQLSSKAIIRVSGEKSSEFLQGLITNDMRHIAEGAPSIFALFLNTRGRVLYDSFIYSTKDKSVFWVECDSQVESELLSHLKTYTVRRKISIDSISDQFCTWVIVSKKLVDSIFPSVEFSLLNKVDSSHGNAPELTLKVGVDHIVVPDPRTPSLGYRLIMKKELPVYEVFNDAGHSTFKGKTFYQRLRYSLGVGEGATELPVGNCFPLEVNCDYLHGVSFHKGCYIGQELTARTHHTGVVRKRYMPLFFNKAPESLTFDSPVTAGDKPVGKIRGFSNNVGLGLLRVDESLSSGILQSGSSECSTRRPAWWPTEAPKRI